MNLFDVGCQRQLTSNATPVSPCFEIPGAMSALVKTASTAFLLGLSIFSPTVLAAPSRRGLTQFPPHDDTVSTCTWFVDYDGSETCADIVKDNFITLEDLMKWV